MVGKKYQSCSVPYENEILVLRREKPPVRQKINHDVIKFEQMIVMTQSPYDLFIYLFAQYFHSSFKYAVKIIFKVI